MATSTATPALRRYSPINVCAARHRLRHLLEPQGDDPRRREGGRNALYACPYEGFEASEHVVYLNACPNQHLVPLLAHVVPRHGPNGFLIGSNYIWGWETNRVARDLIEDAGGRVLGERYIAIGETGIGRLIDEIRTTRPDFVLNNLIGTSSYAFIDAYAALGRNDPHFLPTRCPLLSCNLTECELPRDRRRG